MDMELVKEHDVATGDDALDRAVDQFNAMLADPELSIRGQLKGAVAWAQQRAYPNPQRRQQAANEIARLEKAVREFFLNAEHSAIVREIRNFNSAIRTLAAPIPTPSPSEQVEKFLPGFTHFRYRPDEIGRFITALKSGERLLGVALREITTSDRVIPRSALAELGMPAAMTGVYRERWRAAVPSEAELQQIESDLAREAKAAGHAWSPE